MQIQDDLIVLLWEEALGGFTTEIMERLPAEDNAAFVNRIISQIVELSAANGGTQIVVYTGEAAGSTTLGPIQIVDLAPSFIDELLGG